MEFLRGIANSSTDGNTVRLPPILFQPIAADDVAARRRSERERLIAARFAMSADGRLEHAARIANDLDAFVAIAPAPSDITRLLRIDGHAQIRWIELMHETGRRRVLARTLLIIFAGAIATHGPFSSHYIGRARAPS